MAAVALICGSFVLAATGAAGSIGASFRSTLEPVLRWVRDRSMLSRAELADATILLAIALALSSVVADRRFMALVIAAGLWLARPSVRRVTSEEHRMLALAGYFSTDLVIGIYMPITLAQFLLADVLLGMSLLAVVVALSWPPGGGEAMPGRRWRLAPVAS